MWIRVRLIGTGVQGDEFRAPIPSYKGLILDSETPLGIGAPRWCIINLLDEDYLPPLASEVAPTIINVAQLGQVIRALDPNHRARIIAALKDKYHEHAATYTVQDT